MISATVSYAARSFADDDLADCPPVVFALHDPTEGTHVCMCGTSEAPATAPLTWT